MSTVNTTLNVLQWAIAHPTGEVMPPVGDFSGIEQLSPPPDSLTQALQELVAVTAARLKLPPDVINSSTPISSDTLLLAAAIGIAPLEKNIASVLITHLYTYRFTIGDLLGWHGLVMPALSTSPAFIREDLRSKSPLTMLLTHPNGQQSIVLQMLDKFDLQHNPALRQCIILQLAAPTSDLESRRWRSDLLLRYLRQGDVKQQFVLDIYETQMIYYAAEAMKQVHMADKILRTPFKLQTDESLQFALSVAEWWKALRLIQRDNIDTLRTRQYLAYDYLKGIRLYSLAQKLTGGRL